MRVLVAALLTLTVLFSVGTATSSTVSAVSEGLLSVDGTRIVNPIGKPVSLRGVNYVGYESDDANLPLHSESAYVLFAKVGFNVVRLPISWAHLEPRLGAFSESYLAKYVDRDVQWAKKYGLYVVLDMHQFNWGKRFGGDGVPNWLVQQYPSTEVGMRRAVSDFWSQPAKQQYLIDVWRRIAQRYVNETTIAGYDILNEPWVYTSINPSLDVSDVNDFYVRVISSVRSVDRNHIIFLEPTNMPPSDFPVQDRIVWAPHFYALSFNPVYTKSDATVLEADVAAKYQRFVVGMRSPLWIGEFGAFMKDSSSDEWLRDTVGVFDKYQVGWAWWAFSGMSDRLPSALYQIPSAQTSTTNTVEPAALTETYVMILEAIVALAIVVPLVALAYLGLSRRRRAS